MMQEVEVGVLHNDFENIISLPKAFDVERKEFVSVVHVIKSNCKLLPVFVLNYSHCDSQTSIFLGGLLPQSTLLKAHLKLLSLRNFFFLIKINKSESKLFILD